MPVGLPILLQGYGSNRSISLAVSCTFTRELRRLKLVGPPLRTNQSWQLRLMMEKSLLRVKMSCWKVLEQFRKRTQKKHSKWMVRYTGGGWEEFDKDGNSLKITDQKKRH